MSFSSLFPPSTAEKKAERASSSLFLGGFLAICSSFSTLTPVMAAGIQNLANFNGSNCSGLQTAGLRLANKAFFGSHYLQTGSAPDSHYLQTGLQTTTQAQIIYK